MTTSRSLPVLPCECSPSSRPPSGIPLPHDAATTAHPTLAAAVESEADPQVTRARRLRARRLKPNDLLQPGQIQARAEHSTLGHLDCLVEDLSLNGMALVLRNGAEPTSLALIGDRLERLEVSCPDGAIYQGSASVRRVSERDGDLVLGVETHSRGIDLGALYRLGTRQSFQERLEAVLGPDEDDVSQQFKAWVADLRSYLERAQDFLRTEEELLEDLDSYSRSQALATYRETGAPRLLERLNRASSELRMLVSELTDEQHQASRAYYKSQLLPLFQKSPILKRASSKPLGYAGDYEMMNMLYRDHAEGNSLFGQAVNIYAAQEPAASAVVNRLEYLSAKIRSAIAVRGKVRLASIGCGPAKELAHLLEQCPELGPYLDVALIDQEERVISYCERTLGPLANQTGARIHFIRESVRRLLTTRTLSVALGERDLIYSAGLFDYLDERSFSSLLSVLYEALPPTGQLVIGNYSADNPSRYFMEYCLDWFLIHRTEEQLLEFTQKLAPRPSRASVESEALGVNLFLNVWK